MAQIYLIDTEKARKHQFDIELETGLTMSDNRELVDLPRDGLFLAMYDMTRIYAELNKSPFGDL